MINSTTKLASSGQNGPAVAAWGPELKNPVPVAAEFGHWLEYESLFLRAAELFLKHDGIIPPIIALCRGSIDERAYWDKRLLDRGTRLDVQRLILPFERDPKDLTFQDMAEVPAFARTLSAAKALSGLPPDENPFAQIALGQERITNFAGRIESLIGDLPNTKDSVPCLGLDKLVKLGELQLLTMRRREEIPRLLDKWAARHGVVLETLREMIREKGVESASGIMSAISGAPLTVVRFCLQRISESDPGVAAELEGFRETLSVLIPLAREAADVRDRILRGARGLPEECLEDIVAAEINVTSWGDAIGHGHVALCRAVDTFCPFAGPFGAYAMPLIQEAQVRFLDPGRDDEQPVPLTSIADPRAGARSEEDEMISVLRRQEIKTGYLLYKVSGDSPIQHEDLRIKNIAEEFRALLAELSPLEQAILEFRWLTEEPIEQEQLATKMGCSGEAIRCAESEVLQILNSRLRTLKILRRIGRDLSGE